MRSKGPTDVRRYDGSGVYELRDANGRLYAKGDYKWCISRLQDVQHHSAERALREGGWRIEKSACVSI